MAKLFESYEALKSTPQWSRLWRFITGSAVLHLLFAAYLIYVPAMRSMLHLASLFSDVDYVNEDYDRTIIGERAVMLKSGERFQYPPGYFSSGKGQAQPTATPKIVAEARPRPTPKPRPAPTPAPTPVPQPTLKPTPQPSPVATPSPTVVRAEGQGAGDAAKTDAGATPPLDPKAEEAINQQAAETKIKRPKMVNKKPFLDLLTKANQMKERGELNLSGTITMTIEADRNSDGTLTKVNVTSSRTSDEQLKKLAKEFVAALSASTALSFLEDARHLRMKIDLNQQSVNAEIDTEVDTEQRATEMKKGYSGIITLARFARRGKDDAMILNNTTVSSSGKQVTVRFTMGREAATKLLTKQLPSS